jgi:hypothetical protein
MTVHWFTNFCDMSMYESFVMHLPEEGHMSGRNMLEVYFVYNICSCTYVHLLVLAATSNSIVQHNYESICVKYIIPYRE